MLAQRFVVEQRYAELFDVRLMQIRLRNGLPAAESLSIEKLPEPLRGAIEQAYLEACREIGRGLLHQGRVRDAWRYLRPAGEQAAVAAELAKIPADEEHLEELIDVALHEGVAPELGFELVLAKLGTCNAISAMETVMNQFPLATRQAAAAKLIRQLHGELLENVRDEIAEREGSRSAEDNLAELFAKRKWLVAEGRFHVDVSHLAAVVRAARIVTEPEVLRLAFDLTEYGRQLDRTHQFADDEPFTEMYPSHGLFFAAQLGSQVDAAICALSRSGGCSGGRVERRAGGRGLCCAFGTAQAVSRCDRCHAAVVAGDAVSDRLCAVAARACAT